MNPMVISPSGVVLRTNYCSYKDFNTQYLFLIHILSLIKFIIFFNSY